MPCKMETRKRAWKLRESVASENTNPRKKTRYACIVKPRESKRKRVESSLPRNREDHIAERGLILWQYHHWKAKDGSTNVDKRGYSTVAERRRDDPSYRQTQQDHGWTLEYCIFLVYLKTVEIEHKATWDENRYKKNQYVSRWKEVQNPGKMSVQDSFVSSMCSWLERRTGR